MCVISDEEFEENDAKFTVYTPDGLRRMEKPSAVHLDTGDCADAEKIINDLVLACESALLLRGLWTAILDPLALKGEKEDLRTRFKEIEAQIKRAIEAAKK